MSKILDEENKYLDYVEKVIESELQKSLCDTEKLKMILLNFHLKTD